MSNTRYHEASSPLSTADNRERMGCNEKLIRKYTDVLPLFEIETMKTQMELLPRALQLLWVLVKLEE